MIDYINYIAKVSEGLPEKFKIYYDNHEIYTRKTHKNNYLIKDVENLIKERLSWPEYQEGIRRRFILGKINEELKELFHECFIKFGDIDSCSLYYKYPVCYGYYQKNDLKYCPYCGHKMTDEMREEYFEKEKIVKEYFHRSLGIEEEVVGNWYYDF